MPTFRLMAVLIALFALATPKANGQQADETTGDPVRGKIVYRTVGQCVNCHGWPGDGLTGLLLQAPRGANLRQSELDDETLLEVIKCGLPGTAMPFHGRTAYRDSSCYEMTMSEFAPENKPRRGKTFSDDDIVNLVAYLRAGVIGLGEPTFDECAEFFDSPDANACSRLK